MAKIHSLEQLSDTYVSFMGLSFIRLGDVSVLKVFGFHVYERVGVNWQIAKGLFGVVGGKPKILWF